MSRRKPYNVQIKMTEAQAESVLDLIEDELEVDDDELDAAERSRLVAAKRSIKDSLWRLDQRIGRVGEKREGE